MNLYNYLTKNKPTREHNVTLHHFLPITLRYIKERRKTMRSEAASSHRATSNPSTIRFSFHFHFISENHGSPTPHCPAPHLTLQNSTIISHITLQTNDYYVCFIQHSLHVRSLCSRPLFSPFHGPLKLRQQKPTKRRGTCKACWMKQTL